LHFAYYCGYIGVWTLTSIWSIHCLFYINKNSRIIIIYVIKFNIIPILQSLILFLYEILIIIIIVVVVVYNFNSTTFNDFGRYYYYIAIARISKTKKLNQYHSDLDFCTWNVLKIIFFFCKKEHVCCIYLNSYMSSRPSKRPVFRLNVTHYLYILEVPK